MGLYAHVFIDNGLGEKAKEFYAQRRKVFTREIKEEVLIQSGVNLLYLTGIKQEEAALLIGPKKEILFLEKRDEKKEFWVGRELDVENAVEITGVKNVKDIKDLNKKLKKPSKEVLGKLLELRISLDEVEQKNAQIANDITAAVFEQLRNELKGFVNEREVNGFLVGGLKMFSQFGLAFEPIAASGKSALTLHYQKNDENFKNGELLLVDFGVKWQNMCADISRTIPIGGKFNALQKIIYAIVLDAQKLVEKNVKPGVTMKELDEICWGFINKELKKRFIKRGGKMTLKYKVRPHTVNHLIGYNVHEGNKKSREQKLKPGWLISNEPGIYGHFEIVLEGKEYKEDIGIRIEDDLLVTAKGCLNLSESCPKTIEEMEN